MPDDAAAETTQEALARALAELRAGRREAHERVVELCQSKLFGFALSLMKDYEARLDAPRAATRPSYSPCCR